MLQKKKKILIFVGKVMLVTLLIVLLVRCFLIEPFSVSSRAMYPVLIDGDEVLVDKTAYGIRLPITPLSIPFTFDRCYSRAIELPYCRLFSGRVSKNDIVLYNNPQETDKPLDKRTLLLGRCSLLPGDSVTIDNAVLYYKFAVPARGMKIELTENNLNIYCHTILSECDSATLEYGQLYMDGKRQTAYTFANDYYWMKSDNPKDSTDSGTLGFIPFANIVGKARFIWYSSDAGRYIRSDRCFSTIN